jgi:hypothetical protein
MCMYYRKLNNLTIKNKFPISIIDDLLDEHKDACFFSKLDIRADYHQIGMEANSIPLTTFRIHNGLFEFIVMPFDLTNALATF